MKTQKTKSTEFSWKELKKEINLAYKFGMEKEDFLGYYCATLGLVDILKKIGRAKNDYRVEELLSMQNYLMRKAVRISDNALINLKERIKWKMENSESIAKFDGKIDKEKEKDKDGNIQDNNKI
jgi:hypothetical protein